MQLPGHPKRSAAQHSLLNVNTWHTSKEVLAHVFCTVADLQGLSLGFEVDLNPNWLAVVVLT